MKTYFVLEKYKKLSPVFGLSVLGFSRNVAVQHGRLHEREPAPSLYKKSYFKVMKTHVLVFLHPTKSYTIDL